jgi:hypothetical protein
MISGKNGVNKFPGNVWRSITDPVLNGPFVTDITDPYKLNKLEGLKLQSRSPLRDSGVNIISMFGFDPPIMDFFGNPVPQGTVPEPGIHELE